MNDNTLIKKVVEYIENHLEDNLSLDKISHELSYSKYYMERVFVKKTGCTIYKYIQGRRLTLAAQKLVETEKPVIEISYEAQYSSQQAFALAFRQAYFCTPQTYRKNGTFYPVQPKINVENMPFCLSPSHSMQGGKMAA